MEPDPDSIGIGSIIYAVPGIGPTRNFVTRSITNFYSPLLLECKVLGKSENGEKIG